MSNLFKRKDSPYWYYTAGGDKNRVIKSTGTESKKIAFLLKRKWDEEFILKKHGVVTDKILLFDLIDEYLDVITPIKSESRITRLNIYAKTFKNMLPNINASEIKLSMINKFIAARLKERHPATVHYEVSFLKDVLEYANKNEYVRKNVVLDAELPKVSFKKNSPFSGDILHKIFEMATDKDLIYWKVLLYTGLRAGDAGTIKKEHIKDGFIIRLQGKTNNQVTIPIHSEIQNYNIIDIMPTKYLRTQSWKRLKKILAKLEVDGNLHSFRHTFASRLFNSGLSVEDIKVVTGHSVSKMTVTYTHPDMKRIKKVFNQL